MNVAEKQKTSWVSGIEVYLVPGAYVTNVEIAAPGNSVSVSSANSLPMGSALFGRLLNCELLRSNREVLACRERVDYPANRAGPDDQRRVPRYGKG